MIHFYSRYTGNLIIEYNYENGLDYFLIECVYADANFMILIISTVHTRSTGR